MSELAAVLADIRSGNVDRAIDQPKLHQAVNDLAREAPGPLIDATFIYHSYREKPEIALYEDHPSILPPWETAWVGYRNEHGNAMVSLVVADPWKPSHKWESSAGNSFDGAAHRLMIWTFAGGRMEGGTKPSPTMGPIALTRVAVSADGAPLDIGWVDITGSGQAEQWDWPRWTVLGTYSFMGCRNIDIVERTDFGRAGIRREQRIGVRSHVLTVTARGARSEALTVPGGGQATLPLHSVRGHYAHYGACCSHHEPRGLLFGKHTGRVWVPQFAKGTADAGSVDQTFILTD